MKVAFSFWSPLGLNVWVMLAVLFVASPVQNSRYVRASHKASF